MSTVKKLHSADDFSKPANFLLCKEKVRISPSAFSAFSRSSSNWLPFSGSDNRSKFHKQFALFLFGNQMRIESCKDRKGIIRRRQPLPYGVLVLSIYSNTSLKSLFDIYNSVWLTIAGFDGGRKGWFCMRKCFTFPATKASISFHKTCKPLVEFFIGDNRSFDFHLFSRRDSRSFTSSNLGNKVFSSESSIFSPQVKIFSEQKKLGSFYYGKFFDLSDESFLIGNKRIPGKNIFLMVSFCQINISAKVLFKKVGGCFACNGNRDPRITTRSQGNASFCIKKTRKISHHTGKNSFKFHFNSRRHLPATTKCDGVRINSLLCHSLNSRRKRERENRSIFPALWVSRLYAESNRQPNNASALYSEYGNVYNIRILCSSEAPVSRNSSAGGRDVYYNAVVGKQAVTHINQDGYSMNLIYRDPYYSGMLAQNATLAVKFAQAQAITQDTAIRNLLCTKAGN